MTQEQIIEGNKLISLFMGFKEEEIQAEDWCGCNVLEDNGFGGLEMFPANYHENWSRLMPVVEEIESIGQTYVEFGKKHCRIQPILYNPKKDCMEWQLLHETQCATKIEAVYSAVLKFITWYNQQPK